MRDQRHLRNALRKAERHLNEATGLNLGISYVVSSSGSLLMVTCPGACPLVVQGFSLAGEQHYTVPICQAVVAEIDWLRAARSGQLAAND